MSSKDALLKLEPPTATIILNRPEKLNAISMQMLEEILSYVDTIELNNGIRFVILTGSGGNFSAGADLGELYKMDSATAFVFHQKMNRLVTAITSSRKIYISLLQGFALGGGFELSLSTDIRICARDAAIGQPEIRVGLNAGAGGNAVLPRIVGRGNALYMILTGERLSAQRGMELGIVQKIADAKDLGREAASLTELLSKIPEATLALTKFAVGASQNSGPGYSLDVEAQVFSMLNANPDVKEKIRKFLDKKSDLK